MDNTELQFIATMRKQAIEDVNRNTPDLQSSFAGIALSKDGSQKIIDVLDRFFSELVEVADKLPDEFSLSISPEDLANVDARAMMYLFLDQFRPNYGIAILPSARDQKNKYEKQMNQRAMFAALNIQKVRSVLRKT